MTKNSRSWIYFGLSTAALAVCYVMVGMTNHAPIPKPKVEIEALKALSPAVMKAKDELCNELNRRFTDRQNVDFGMSRVIRVGERLHFGPTMDIQASFRENRRRTVGGQTELLLEGEWIKDTEVKPIMSPENDIELHAIQTLQDSKVDVAIYTVGQFHWDRGQVPGPTSSQVDDKYLNYKDFSWEPDGGLRARGPAYITQKATFAPRAYEVVDFGRKAWASRETDYVAEGKDGWIYFAHRVEAPDVSCIKCHGNTKSTSGNLQGSVQKAGDPVGLFIIALRKD